MLMVHVDGSKAIDCTHASIFGLTCRRMWSHLALKDADVALNQEACMACHGHLAYLAVCSSMLSTTGGNSPSMLQNKIPCFCHSAANM